MLDRLLDKLKEPSTIRGLCILGGVCGLNYGLDLEKTIAVVGTIIGLFETVRKEKK